LPRLRDQLSCACHSFRKLKRALTAVLATLASGFVLLLWVFVRKAILAAGEDPQTQAQLQHISRSLKRAIWR